MKKIQKGFTLIELMIVVAIIGILAAVAIPSYQDYIVKAKMSKVQSTIDSVKFALALYAQEYGGFPAGTIDSTVAADNGIGTINIWGSIGLKTGERPTLPPEVQLMTVAQYNGGTGMTMALTIRGIKAVTMDTLQVVILGETGSTATTWSCVNSAGVAVKSPAGTTGVAPVTTVTDVLALKYFGCQ